MEDCLFCMIAEGKIPSKKLYEDDQVVAFYDINPQAKVHFLVVPRKHISSAAALTEEDGALLGHIFTVIAKLAKEQGSFDTRAGTLSPVSTGGKTQEAASALAVLGYSSQEISAALKGVDTALPVEEIIRIALKKMVR